MQLVSAAIAHLIRTEDGQDLIEYGLIASLIAIALILSVTSLGQTINSVLWAPIAPAV
jgi:Flp pilus assembly pilin Flp